VAGEIGPFGHQDSCCTPYLADGVTLRQKRAFSKLHTKDIPLTNRELREYELKTMLANHLGRNQLTQLLRQYLNIPSGQLPHGTPFVETILAHEFIDPPGSTCA
jgi:hypothetical protein